MHRSRIGIVAIKIEHVLRSISPLSPHWARSISSQPGLNVIASHPEPKRGANRNNRILRHAIGYPAKSKSERRMLTIGERDGRGVSPLGGHKVNPISGWGDRRENLRRLDDYLANTELTERSEARALGGKDCRTGRTDRNGQPRFLARDAFKRTQFLDMRRTDERRKREVGLDH